MILLVCGGREYDNRDDLWKALDAIRRSRGIELLVHGGCGKVDPKTGRVICGADKLAGVWAEARGVPAKAYPADWDKYGDAAGPIRNRQMLAAHKIDGVCAFPGRKGTKNMTDAADGAGIKVWRPYGEG